MRRNHDPKGWQCTLEVRAVQDLEAAHNMRPRSPPFCGWHVLYRCWKGQCWKLRNWEALALPGDWNPRIWKALSRSLGKTGKIKTTCSPHHTNSFINKCLFWEFLVRGTVAKKGKILTKWQNVSLAIQIRFWKGVFFDFFVATIDWAAIWLQQQVVFVPFAAMEEAKRWTWEDGPWGVGGLRTKPKQLCPDPAKKNKQHQGSSLPGIWTGFVGSSLVDQLHPLAVCTGCHKDFQYPSNLRQRMEGYEKYRGAEPLLKNPRLDCSRLYTADWRLSCCAFSLTSCKSKKFSPDFWSFRNRSCFIWICLQTYLILNMCKYIHIYIFAFIYIAIL